MNLTIAVLAGTAIFLTAFDIYIIKKKGKPESISAHVIRFVYKHKKGFLTGLICGFIAGHLGWNMKSSDIYPNTECKEIILDKPTE